MPPNETTLDFDEHTLDTPEIIDADAFPDYCLDLYDTIKFGKRKERKRAAQKLVLFAVELAASLDTALDELHDAEVKNNHLAQEIARGTPFIETPGAAHDGNNGSPWWMRDPEGPMTAPLYNDTEEARPEPTCVLNEHAHGDDHNAVIGRVGDGWAHVDEAVDQKLKAPPAGTDDARGSS